MTFSDFQWLGKYSIPLRAQVLSYTINYCYQAYNNQKQPHYSGIADFPLHRNRFNPPVYLFVKPRLHAYSRGGVKKYKYADNYAGSGD